MVVRHCTRTSYSNEKLATVPLLALFSDIKHFYIEKRKRILLIFMGLLKINISNNQGLTILTSFHLSEKKSSLKRNYCITLKI